MNAGLIGFGKTGRAVAGVLLEAEDIKLRWVLRQSKALEQRSAAEFLDIGDNNDGLIFSAETTPITELLDAHPVDEQW